MMKRLAIVLVLNGFLISATAVDRPNLIVIMVDDMGYAGLSCFGNPWFETPELDKMAAEGMKFTDFHSSGTVCSPTRAGLLTGRYQQRSGIEVVIHPHSDHPEHRKGLQLSEITFAEVLKEAGYKTGIIGKWHQGYPENSEDYHPQNHGFDEFYGYHSGNIDFVSHVGDHNKHDWWHGREELREEGYATDLINEHADRFVRKHATPDDPFCLYIAHLAVHNPIQVRGDPVRRTEEAWTRWNWKEHTLEEQAGKLKGMTLPIDEGIGMLRNTLRELGIEKDTFLLFFSDNGGTREGPGSSPDLRGLKGSVYEGGHRVPAIACWPGKIPGGAVSDDLLISLDVMPTLLSLAGAEIPDRRLDGIDFSKVFLEQETLESRPLFWASVSNRLQRSEAMRDGPWKLVVSHPRTAPRSFENETFELYHLGKDPGETNDLASRYPQRTSEMAGRVKTWFREVTSSATVQPANP